MKRKPNKKQKVKALEESVRKYWSYRTMGPEEIEESLGFKGCTCCQLIRDKSLSPAESNQYPCDRGCPIYGHTGDMHCSGTPYADFLTEVIELNSGVEENPHFLKAALRRELRFLIEVLRGAK